MIVRVSSNTSLMAAQISSLRHAHDLVAPSRAQCEGVLADLAHRDAVGEDADVSSRTRATGRQRLVHRVGLERLDADDLDIRHAAP